MARLTQVVLGTVVVLLGAIALAGCGGSSGRTAPATVTGVVHSASHQYSVGQVEQAFAVNGIELKDVTARGYRKLLAFLDGRPAHAVYVYVIREPCKCLFEDPIRHAHKTHHGNLTVLWRPAERSAVRAALRRLR